MGTEVRRERTEVRRERTEVRRERTGGGEKEPEGERKNRRGRERTGGGEKEPEGERKNRRGRETGNTNLEEARFISFSTLSGWTQSPKGKKLRH